MHRKKILSSLKPVKRPFQTRQVVSSSKNDSDPRSCSFSNYIIIQSERMVPSVDTVPSMESRVQT